MNAFASRALVAACLIAITSVNSSAETETLPVAVQGKLGTTTTVKVTVTNSTDKKVEIKPPVAGCSCIRTKSFLDELDPKGKGNVVLDVYFSPKGSVQRQNIAVTDTSGALLMMIEVIMFYLDFCNK